MLSSADVTCLWGMLQISFLYICGKMTREPSVATALVQMRSKTDTASSQLQTPDQLMVLKDRNQFNKSQSSVPVSMQKSTMKGTVVCAYKSKAYSTCVINAVLFTVVCGAFITGMLCGLLFLNTRAREPCTAGREMVSKEDASQLNDVTPRQNKTAAMPGSELKILPHVVEENLTAVLENWTDVLSMSLKNVVQKEIQSLEKTLNKWKPYKNCQKGSAKLKDVKTSILVNWITNQLNQTVEKLVAKNLEEIRSKKVSRDPPRKVHSFRQTTTVSTVSADTKALDFVKKTNKDGENGISSCPRGWSIFHGSCYKVHNAHAFQWNIARQSCLAGQADMVVISSAEENQFVYSLARAQAPTRKYLWLGLLRGSWSEKFFWVDKTPVFYSRWAHNEPNNRNRNGENCVHMYIWKGSNAMQWNDELCVNPSIGSMAYMCEKAAIQHSRQVEDGPIWIESEGSADETTSGSGDDNSLAA